MTHSDLGVPASIPRDKFVDWLKDLGIDPGKCLSIRMDHKGIYAEMFAYGPNGNKILTDKGVAKHSVFVRFED